MTTDLPVSQLGQYRLIDKLGQGGMAAVYKAHQPNMDRTVAIKVLPPVLKLDPDFANRFRQEAKIIASLEHARILPVHDYGEEGDYTYLVMRYLEGSTLHQRIKTEGPFSLDEAARVIRQVAEGLNYAHSKNIIHRDMSSNNVMFDGVGSAYITDFGLAKMVAGSAHLTGHSIVGTPAYVAPEQAMGEKPDPRTDIYALGVVLFEMLIGDVPFQGDTPMVVIFKHVNEPLPHPQELRPELPTDVAEVILKATEKDPNDRFASTLEMADALEKAVRAVSAEEAAYRPERASFVGVAIDRDQIEKTAPPTARQSARRSVSPSPPVVERPSAGAPVWLVPVLGVVALLLVGVIAVMLLRPSMFGVAPQATETQQAEIAPSATTELAATATQAQAEPTETAEPTDEATDTPSTLEATAVDTQEGLPSGVPPDGSLFLVDAGTLPCEEGETPLLAVDFDERQEFKIDVLRGPDAGFAFLDGIWLTLPVMQPESGISLAAVQRAQRPHITARVAWLDGPGVFGLVSTSGPPPSEPYAFFISEQGMELKRGRGNLNSVATSADVMDGEPHVIGFIVNNGHLQGFIDGVLMIEATDPAPLVAGEGGLHVEVNPISVDYITICDLPAP